MKISTFSEKDLDNRWGLIDCYQDLAGVTGLKTRYFSNILHMKDNRPEKLQKLKRLKGRIVYDSSAELKLVQKRLMVIFQGLLHTIPNNHMLAYVKGRKAIEEIKQRCAGHDLEVTWDIKKCYDSITTNHIIKTLKAFGFTHRGAMLVARYCTVRRTLPNGKTISTLQQGSPCSPVLSNLVCHQFIDRKLLAFIDSLKTEENRVEYVRFSDNVGLFISGKIDQGLVKRYLEESRKILEEGKFRYHDLQIIKNNHPKRNQRFLGIVLNHSARIDKKDFAKTQAILFNAMRCGLFTEAVRYIQQKMICGKDSFSILSMEGDEIIDKFLSEMRGKASYIKQISLKQYTALRNLINTIELINTFPELVEYQLTNSNLPDDLFRKFATQYRKMSVSEYSDFVSEELLNYFNKNAEKVAA